MDELECKMKTFKRVIAKKNVNNDSKADSDEDFIEVRNKRDVEAAVKAEDHAMGINFYPAVNQPSTSKGINKPSTSKVIGRQFFLSISICLLH